MWKFFYLYDLINGINGLQVAGTDGGIWRIKPHGEVLLGRGGYAKNSLGWERFTEDSNTAAILISDLAVAVPHPLGFSSPEAECQVLWSLHGLKVSQLNKWWSSNMKCYSCMKNNTLCDVHALGTWMAVLGLSNGDDNSVNPNNQVTAFMKFSFPVLFLFC